MEMDYTYALARNFHSRIQNEMATELQKLITSQPIVAFDRLTSGQVVYFKPRYGKGDEILEVIKLLPSGKMVDTKVYGDGREKRIRPNNYHGAFYLMNDETLSFVGMTHEGVVKEAMQRGLPIPPSVRIYYPNLFVVLPERFKPERLERILKPEWHRVMTAEIVDQMIAEHHKSIAQLQEEMPKAVVLNPSVRSDYDGYINNRKEDIDFYRWLRPLVDAGGVFYVESEKAAAA